MHACRGGSVEKRAHSLLRRSILKEEEHSCKGNIQYPYTYTNKAVEQQEQDIGGVPKIKLEKRLSILSE